MNAKAGELITSEARKRIAESTGASANMVPPMVSPKGPERVGQHVCITCGELLQNNMEAACHEEANRNHKMAWRSFDSGLIEEP